MATNDLRDRLERLRLEAGFQTLKDFREEIIRQAPGRSEYAIHYATVRNYHSEGREPAVSYLQRILEVFPWYRPEWLLLGEEPPTKNESERALALAALLDTTLAGRALGEDERFSGLLQSPVRELLEAMVDRLVRAEPERCTGSDITPEDICRDVAALLLLPTTLWGFAGLGFNLRSQRYLVGMLNALETLVHEQREGQSAAEYAGSSIHAVRELVAAATKKEAPDA